MSKEYLNLKTGEVTENHRQAVEWYREGCEVAILVNGIEKLRWFF